MMRKDHEIAVGQIEHIERRIVLIRGQRVLLDADLAELYGVSTKRLNEQIKRNLRRFPTDFMFQLSNQEVVGLRSRFATSKRGGRRYLPNVFTEYGAIMAANVLNSDRAIDASVYVVRAFVKLREVLYANQELSRKLGELEHRIDTHDEAMRSLFTAIRQLMTPPKRKEKRIGFHLDHDVTDES